MSIAEMPEGQSVVECDAVGVIVESGGLGLTIPEPGMAAGVETVLADGGVDGFQVEVAEDGTISYPELPEAVEGGQGDVGIVDGVERDGDPGECSDDAYNTNDLKEYDTYNWWIGDGGMPGALSRSDAQAAFADAINNITGSFTSCQLSDTVDATASYKGTTTYEADMDSNGNCTDRDEKSTWDAGDLESGTVASTCWWSTSMPGVKNDLREADVRYNTHDYNFTNTGGSSSCSGQYDIRSVGTHEAGHVFGMGHVGSGHSNLTMYTNSFICKTKARTLGAGDIIGLRSIY